MAFPFVAELVARVYAAIGRGDIPEVIDLTTDDVEIVFPGPATIPFAGTYHATDGVTELFQTIGASVEISRFEPRESIVQDDQAVVLGSEHLTAKPTGRSWKTDWAMVWTIRDGKVPRLRQFHETEAPAAAFR